VFLWETPEGERIVAAGADARFEGGGHARFQAARAWVRERAASREPGAASANLCVAGFSFAETAATGWGIQDSALWIPAMLDRAPDPGSGEEDAAPRARAGGEAGPARRHGPGPPGSEASAGADWDEGAWTRAVEAALEEIRAGTFEKVVLARSREIRSGRGWNLSKVFAALRTRYPSAYRFLLSDGRGSVFLGASPERLVSLREGRVDADAVAGTGRVNPSADPGARAAAASALLADRKQRLEHSVVVRDIVAGLSPHCADLVSDPEPSVAPHHHLLHLRSRVSGIARAGTHVLDLVAQLHPTPAVAGSPRASALEFIREWEPRERGWYAGPIGWLDADGDGDFTVGLRSALVRGDRAILFGGAGIVAGSDPASEWRECDAKIEAILDVLSHG
jgi:isochorismate synthase